MSEDRPANDGFKETSLADHSLREIASDFVDALQDLTGNVYHVDITAVDFRPKGVYMPEARDVADVRLRIRRVDDDGIPDKDG